MYAFQDETTFVELEVPQAAKSEELTLSLDHEGQYA